MCGRRSRPVRSPAVGTDRPDEGGSAHPQSAETEGSVDRRLPVVVLSSVLVLLSAPGLARAATTVGVVHTGGLDIVVADDSDSSSTINTALAQVGGPNLRVQNPDEVTAGTECQIIDPPDNTVVACAGTFDAVIVYGNGGNDTITLGLTDKTGVEP